MLRDRIADRDKDCGAFCKCREFSTAGEKEALACGWHDLYERHRGCNRIERVSKPLPFVVAAAQGTHTLDAQLVKSHSGLCRGCFAGACAVENHIAIARNLMDPC